MNKICTSIEQSKKLIELGIDVNTADMYWWNCHGLKLSVSPYTEKIKKGFEKYCLECIPAWSLSVLLRLIPLPMLTQHNNGKWYIASYPNGIIKTSNEYDNPLDVVFEMVCWLLENKKI